MKQPKRFSVSFLLLFLCHFLLSGCTIGESVAFFVSNKCPFPIWPAMASNAEYPVIADGGFFLPSGQTQKFHAPHTWSGRLWARTGCNFNSTSKQPSCQTGDCEGRLACNGSIGLPPATLVQVSLQADKSKPTFFDVSLVDGYNLPVSVSTKPLAPNCSIGGCMKNLNTMCPQELKVAGLDGSSVVACKSACLAFDLDMFCCRNSYGVPEKCKPNMYSKMFKDACPSYFSYAYDTPAPMMSCFSKEYVITFCPSKWGAQFAM
ncbi:thaumatin-like protein [Tasmannia lanceolata]|uniref:thaumatin-like protein n=1 Tax=Tasmannia lanceolata TaxID=3420 RepID=UPI0040637CBA